MWLVLLTAWQVPLEFTELVNSLWRELYALPFSSSHPHRSLIQTGERRGSQALQARGTSENT